MNLNNNAARRSIWLLVVLLLTGCNLPGLAAPAPTLNATSFPTTLPTVMIDPTTEPAPTTAAVEPTTEPTATPVSLPSVWIEPYVPQEIRASLSQSEQVIVSDSAEGALRLGIIPSNESQLGRWIYALVAPFPTITDGVSFDELQRFWRGESEGPFGERPILFSSDTLAVFRAAWGEPSAGSVEVLSEDELLDYAWEHRPSWAVVPFERLEPRWKVLSVDGQSPIRNEFNPEAYPLALSFGFSEGEIPFEMNGFLVTNRDPEKLTVLVMTGVTALVRATAYAMENHGMTFPARDIGGWLRDADVTHISNEVSFYADCPDPNPYPGPLYFCSKVEYFDLIKDVGADVVELTGNHNNDSKQVYGVDVVPPTLDLYRQNNMLYYGGGIDLAEARSPAVIEHNGNRLAFIGCNPAGPDYAWATESSPGAAPCGDLSWMQTEIARLKAEGYLPIATFQWFENYSNVAGPDMERAFRSIAESGAVIVNGSQAHTPKEMEFYGDSFIHYGLGNLFFDQMHVDLSFLQIGEQWIPATRLEFIDRHVIYDGRHISTELLTAMLEDYARPRPMTDQERSAFLRDIFTAAGW